MLISPTELPPWESTDLANLRDFLQSTTGQRLLARLVWERPRYSEQVEKRVLESGLLEGYQDCVETIIFLTEPPQKQPERPETYPDLDRDDLWPKEDKTDIVV